jgi:Rrf2 family protein
VKRVKCLPPPRRIHDALLALCGLARVPGPLRAREVAQGVGLPPAQVAKILSQLTWGGFVSSRRGGNGGFWLRNSAEHTRVGDVMAFFERLMDHSSECHDPIARVWCEMTVAGRRVIEQLTLAELMARADKTTSPPAGRQRSRRARAAPGKGLRAD